MKNRIKKFIKENPETSVVIASVVTAVITRRIMNNGAQVIAMQSDTVNDVVYARVIQKNGTVTGFSKALKDLA